MVFGSLLEAADDRAWSLLTFGLVTADLEMVAKMISILFYLSANAVQWFSVVDVRFHLSLAVGINSLKAQSHWG